MTYRSIIELTPHYTALGEILLYAAGATLSLDHSECPQDHPNCVISWGNFVSKVVITLHSPNCVSAILNIADDHAFDDFHKREPEGRRKESHLPMQLLGFQEKNSSSSFR